MVEKLAEMTVDEFFEHGFDPDISDEDNDGEVEEKNVPAVKKQKKGKGTTGSSKHKNQLESLKEKDPEFYKFLQENDEDLLAFSGSDDDDGDEDDDDDGDNDDGDNELDDGDNEDDGDNDDDDDGDNDENDNSDEDVVQSTLEEAEVSDSELSENENDKPSKDVGKELEEDDSEDENENTAMEDEEKEEKKGRKVTEKMIKKWSSGLEENSVKCLKCVFRAFHAAVDAISPDVDEDTNKKPSKKPSVYSVDTGSMYNQLMKLCLKYSVNILGKNLTSYKQKKFTNTHLPSSHKLWSNVKVPLKQYLCDVLQLLRIHTDVSVLTVLLKHCQALCVYYACFPKISKMLLKRLIRMWSSGEEHVRVMAFLCIRTLSFLTPKLYEFIVKKLYLGFVRNSKFVNLKTKPVITFMKNSLIEMFSYNESATYKHGFLYIRQLAITLRSAISVKKKDSFQAVYNWQYISCLQLWSQVVSDLNGDVLKPLIYPVVQINLGVIKLIPAARYYPLRFHCIDSLNYISKKTGVYIPTASFVLSALESNEFMRKPKSSEKPPDFSGILKLSKSQLHTKGFHDSTIDLALESLLEHYVIFSNSIAFPELIFPICHRLKHLIKKCKIFKLCKDMKMLVEKLQSHAETMKKLRDQVAFSPKDIDEVKQWEEERKSSKNNLSEFFETWQSMKKLANTTQSNHNEDLEIPLEKVKSKEKKRKQSNKKDDVDVDVPVKKKKKTKIDKKEDAFENNDDDIVEDYNLSDDDD